MLLMYVEVGLLVLVSVFLHQAAGSCVTAGYDSCCTSYTTSCIGSSSCYCDEICYALGDCCSDIAGLCSQPVNINYLPFFQLNTTSGVSTIALPSVIDGGSDEIPITEPFPFGLDYQTSVYVITNGFLSFGRYYDEFFPSLFPQGDVDDFLVAPFWADIDISNYSSGVGVIRYEVHNTSSSSSFLADVSNFIRSETGSQFIGRWMLLAEWNNVTLYSEPANGTNTFQAVVITSGTESYALFTYQCGSMELSGGATIGFNANDTDMYFANHRLSGTSRVNEVACLNSPRTVWSNVLYQIGTNVSVATPIITSAIPQSSTSVLIAWEPQTKVDGYKLVLEYAVMSQQTSCPGYDDHHTVIVNENVTEIILTGLQEYSVYTFSLVATITLPPGLGDITSSSSVGEVATLQTVPDSVPQDLRTLSTDDTSFTVEWGAVTCIDRNSNITGYTVVYGEVSSSQRDQELIPGTGGEGGMYNITGLTPYTNYSIEVAAVNSNGQTGPFAAVIVETPQGRPGLVGVLSVASCPTSTQLTWSAPLMPNGIITSYEVTLHLTGSGSEEERQEYTSDTTHLLTGLRPQTTYTVTVRAYTIAGSGEEMSVSVTTEAIGRVEGVWTAVYNDTTLAVLWSPHSVPEVTAYILNYSSVPEQQVVLSSCRNSLVVYGLEAEKEYQFQVQAVVEIDGEEFFSQTSVITGSTNAESASSDQPESADSPFLVAVIVMAVILIAVVAVTFIVVVCMVIKHRRHYNVEAATGYDCHVSCSGLHISNMEMMGHGETVDPESIPTAECCAYGTARQYASPRESTQDDDNDVYDVVYGAARQYTSPRETTQDDDNDVYDDVVQPPN